MARALIVINAVVGSNPPNGTALTIGSVVSLDNSNNGGEVSYLWEFLDMPAGSLTTFSNPNIQNPTFTPDSEGTYFIRLTVNATLATESVNTVIAAITQLKSGIRIPAAGETTEESTSRGWAKDVNQTLQLLDNLRADPGYVTGYAAVNLFRGDVVYISGMRLIKAGLPGEEYIPRFSKAPATSATATDLPLYVVQNKLDGGTAVLAKELFYARSFGICGPTTTLGGVAGDKVFVSDTATLSLTRGTYPRRVGTIAYTDGIAYDWIHFDGGLGHHEGRLLLQEDGDIQHINAGFMTIENTVNNEDLILVTNGTGSVVAQSAGTIGLSAGTNGLAIGTVNTAWFTPNNVLSGIATPLVNTDAANKLYVDTAVAAVAVPDVSGYFFWGNAATPNAPTEVCLDPGYCNRIAPATVAAHPQLPMVKAGVLRNMEVRAQVGPTGGGGDTLNFTVWVNGVASSITAALLDTPTTTASDHTNSVAVVAGDFVELRVSGTAGIVGGAKDVSVTLRFAPS